MSLARSERAALADQLAALGPDAPTLCAGWRAADLAAHVVLRERRPDAALGIRVAALRGRAEAVQRRYAALPWAELVRLVRTGPPRWSPMAFGPIDALLNGVELFLHHEDVRRAEPGWTPRTLDAADQAELWRRLPMIARLAMRRVPVGVVLRRPGGETITVGRRGKAAVVVGEPAELVLFASGRRTAARVAVEGGAEIVAALQRAAFGL